MRHKTETLNLLIALIVLSGFLLRLANLSTKDIWLDEAWTILPALLEPHAIVSSAATDDHPPLVWLILHFWMTWTGTSEFTTRFLSVAFGTLTVPLAFRMGASLGGKRCGAAVAMLVAISPFLISMSQQVRPYALLGALGTLATFLLVNLVPNQEKRGLSLAYATTVTLGVYTHYIFIFLVAAHVSYWVLFESFSGYISRRTLVSISIVYGSVALAFFPWIPVMLTQSTAQVGTLYDASLVTIIKRGPDIIAGAFGALAWGPNLALLRDFPVIGWPAAVVIVSIVIKTGYHGYKSRHLAVLAHFLFACIPTFAITSLVIVGKGHELPKYLSFLLPFYVVLLMKGLVAVNNRQSIPAWAIYVTILVLQLAGLYNYYNAPSREEWRQVATYVDSRIGGNDLLVFNASFIEMPFNYYSTFNGERTGFPCRHIIGAQDRACWYPKGREEKTFVEDLRRRSFNRLFLMISHDKDGSSASKGLKAELASMLSLVVEERVGPALIAIYERDRNW